MEQGILSMNCSVVDLVTPSRAVQRLPSLECLDKGYYIFYCFIVDGNIHSKTWLQIPIMDYLFPKFQPLPTLKLMTFPTLFGNQGHRPINRSIAAKRDVWHNFGLVTAGWSTSKILILKSDHCFNAMCCNFRLQVEGLSDLLLMLICMDI